MKAGPEAPCLGLPQTRAHGVWQGGEVAFSVFVTSDQMGVWLLKVTSPPAPGRGEVANEKQELELRSDVRTSRYCSYHHQGP